MGKNWKSDGLKCPVCSVVGKARIVDSRYVLEGMAVWRRRVCVNGHRWTTHEVELVDEVSQLRTVANGRREPRSEHESRRSGGDVLDEFN